MQRLKPYMTKVVEILFAAILVIFSVLAVEQYKAQQHTDQPVRLQLGSCYGDRPQQHPIQ